MKVSLYLNARYGKSQMFLYYPNRLTVDLQEGINVAGLVILLGSWVDPV